jgi:hypothetical protein
MKKYYTIDISNYFNHKMMFDPGKEIDICDDKEGVMGIGVFDKRLQFEQADKIIKGIRYKLNGSKSRYDNLISNRQEIDINIKTKKIKEISILGFNEFGSYRDDIILVSGNERIKKSILFYQLSENIESLYECDKSDRCNIAFSAKSNGFAKIHYYYTIVHVDSHLDRIILPNNIEMHIAAITAVV